MCMLGLSEYYLNSIHYRDSLRLFMNKVRSRLPDYLNSNQSYKIKTYTMCSLPLVVMN